MSFALSLLVGSNNSILLNMHALTYLHLLLQNQLYHKREGTHSTTVFADDSVSLKQGEKTKM